MGKFFASLFLLAIAWQGYEHLFVSPSFARGLPSDLPRAEQEFEAKLEQVFPEGTSVEAVRERLVIAGFRPGPYGHPAQPGGVRKYEMMQFASNALPVHREWLVGWEEVEGKIVSIDGQIRDVNEWF